MLVWNYSKSSSIPKSLQEMHTDTYFDSNLNLIHLIYKKQIGIKVSISVHFLQWRKIWNSFTPTSDSFPFGFMQLYTIDASNQTGRNLMLVWNYSKSSSIPKSLQEMHTDIYFDSNLNLIRLIYKKQISDSSLFTKSYSSLLTNSSDSFTSLEFRIYEFF